MSKPRINYVNGLLGRRGVGKTTYLKNGIDTYLAADPYKKVLIVDTVDHPSYQDIPLIDLELLKRWKRPAVYRIYGRNTEEIIDTINDNFKNGLLIFEDASKYIPKKLEDRDKALVYDSKQKNADVLFCFHGFKATSPDLFTMLDNWVVFKCDHPSTRKSVMTYYDEMLELWERVMKHESRYYNETINIF